MKACHSFPSVDDPRVRLQILRVQGIEGGCINQFLRWPADWPENVALSNDYAMNSALKLFQHYLRWKCTDWRWLKSSLTMSYHAASNHRPWMNQVSRQPPHHCGFSVKNHPMRLWISRFRQDRSVEEKKCEFRKKLPRRDRIGLRRWTTEGIYQWNRRSSCHVSHFVKSTKDNEGHYEHSPIFNKCTVQILQRFVSVRWHLVVVDVFMMLDSMTKKVTISVI